MSKLMVLTATVVLVSALVGTAFAATTKKVSIKDNFYSPKSLTVNRNDTVKWVWRGSNRHDVRVSKGPVKFHSAIKTSGSYTKTMKSRGTYSIFCSVHKSTMKMTVKVK